MLRKGYDESYEDAMEFFENKFKDSEEYTPFLETIKYVQKYGLQHEVFVMAYNYCEDDCSVGKCCQEINIAMMEWDI